MHSQRAFEATLDQHKEKIKYHIKEIESEILNSISKNKTKAIYSLKKVSDFEEIAILRVLKNAGYEIDYYNEGESAIEICWNHYLHISES